MSSSPHLTCSLPRPLPRVHPPACRQGEFTWDLPVLGRWLHYQDPQGKPPCDWWGINYYSRTVFQWNLFPACLPHEVMTDMYYPVYPLGLYKAIQRCGCARLARSLPPQSGQVLG